MLMNILMKMLMNIEMLMMMEILMEMRMEMLMEMLKEIKMEKNTKTEGWSYIPTLAVDLYCEKEEQEWQDSADELLHRLRHFYVYCIVNACEK